MESNEAPNPKTRPFWVFRVNRRPSTSPPTLFDGANLPDVFEHLGETMRSGHQVVTGRRHQRGWRVGGIERDAKDRLLFGKLGWQALDATAEEVPQWNEEARDWTASARVPRGVVAPFGFDGETRMLLVERRLKTSAKTVASVLEKIIGEVEEELAGKQPSRAPITWSVEPVLDANDFRDWLKSLDTVHTISFTARLPNPEPDDAFQDLVDRMEARSATSFTETFRSDAEEGLVAVDQDQDVRQAIAMGEHGFATLRGEGVRDGQQDHYKQVERVATERAEAPSGWDGAKEALRELLKGRARRFLSDD